MVNGESFEVQRTCIWAVSKNFPLGLSTFCGGSSRLDGDGIGRRQRPDACARPPAKAPLLLLSVHRILDIERSVEDYVVSVFGAEVC